MLWMIGMFGCLLTKQAPSIYRYVFRVAIQPSQKLMGCSTPASSGRMMFLRAGASGPMRSILLLGSEFALEGEHSLRFQTPNNGHSQNIWVSQSFPAQSGDYFRFEAHVLHTAEAPLPDGEKLRLGLWFYDHEIRLDEYRSLSINLTSETGVWEHLVVRGPMPADTREVLAVLEFSGCNQACSQLEQFYVDQTSLEYP